MLIQNSLNIGDGRPLTFNDGVPYKIYKYKYI